MHEINKYFQLLATPAKKKNAHPPYSFEWPGEILYISQLNEVLTAKQDHLTINSKFKISTLWISSGTTYSEGLGIDYFKFSRRGKIA